MQDTSYVVRNEPIVQDYPRPEKAPWSDAGLLVGVRHFGDLCLANPHKSASVKLLCPDIETGDGVIVKTEIEAAEVSAAGCVIL